MTSYGDAWLGDPAFVPLLEELDRRACVVYVHPLLPECCSTILPYVPRAMLEFPYDTGRTVLSLLFSGAFARFRKFAGFSRIPAGRSPRFQAASKRYPNAFPSWRRLHRTASQRNSGDSFARPRTRRIADLWRRC